jgi:hypothetical protein
MEDPFKTLRGRSFESELRCRDWRVEEAMEEWHGEAIGATTFVGFWPGLRDQHPE